MKKRKFAMIDRFSEYCDEEEEKEENDDPMDVDMAEDDKTPRGEETAAAANVVQGSANVDSKVVTVVESENASRLLYKRFTSLFNKANVCNVKLITYEVFCHNLIRGRDLFCRACLEAQSSSIRYTDVFAAVVGIVNAKFPEVGESLLKRIISAFKAGLGRQDKPVLLATTKFMSHLVNQKVARAIIAVKLVTLLMENPTIDRIEIAVGFVEECGKTVQQLSPPEFIVMIKGFRIILLKQEVDTRGKSLIENLLVMSNAGFPHFCAVRPELDIVKGDQVGHDMSGYEYDQEEALDFFKANPHFLEKEKAYEKVTRDIIREYSIELRTMFCGQENTYQKYYAGLGEMFCKLHRVYSESFTEYFTQQYSLVPNMKTKELRNVANFFAHLLSNDAISWHCLSCIRLTEEDTISSQRIFIKILLEGMRSNLSIKKLKERLTEPAMEESVQSLFPKDPERAKFVHTFFTSLGYGSITDEKYRDLQQKENARKSKSDTF